MERKTTAPIAIVDDDRSVREALTGLIRSLGYAAIAFERAEDLLSYRSRSNISLVIADVQMPGISGPELHRRLVASGQPIPVILITAYPDERTRRRALRAGVISYLSKPFNEAELVTSIHSIVTVGEGNDSAEPP